MRTTAILRAQYGSDRSRRNPDLRVIARMSAFQYRGKGGDLPRIAAELDVGHVIEGSVRWAGDDIRVTVQLTDAPTSIVLWSECYERRLSNIFSVQDEVCQHIARAIQIRLVDPVRAAALPATLGRTSTTAGCGT